MQIFYTPDITGNEYFLSEDESKHAVRVLRLQNGDSITLVDGKGSLYRAKVHDGNAKHCLVKVDEIIQEFEKRNYRLHIAISPLKNTDRLEWFLEKATEIGIDSITPILCERTERKGFNMERANRIVESAMKQSLKAYHPLISEPINFRNFLKLHFENTVKIICTCEGERQKMDTVYKAGQDAVILIGPEGDFSEKEVHEAVEKGFMPVTLGKSRLRTETAGVIACGSVYFMNITP
jgi:16S rRNA (uracil1498-N3)-methyltransferase